MAAEASAGVNKRHTREKREVRLRRERRSMNRSAFGARVAPAPLSVLGKRGSHNLEMKETVAKTRCKQNDREPIARFIFMYSGRVMQ